VTTSDIEIAADLFAFATAPGTPADKFLEAYVCDLLPRWAEAATVPRPTPRARPAPPGRVPGGGFKFTPPGTTATETRHCGQGLTRRMPRFVAGLRLITGD
jgi:hypothetical protein